MRAYWLLLQCHTLWKARTGGIENRVGRPHNRLRRRSRDRLRQRKKCAHPTAANAGDRVGGDDGWITGLDIRGLAPKSGPVPMHDANPIFKKVGWMMDGSALASTAGSRKLGANN